jgi:hypothetical protein
MLSYEVPYVRKILDLGEETPQLPTNSSPQRTAPFWAMSTLLGAA